MLKTQGQNGFHNKIIYLVIHRVEYLNYTQILFGTEMCPFPY